MNRKRRGSMLVELCSNMAAISMVLLLGVGLIERSMRWTRAMQRQGNLQRELSLLASAWRDDWRQSTRVEFPSPQRVVLSLPDKEIVYESFGERVERQSRRNERGEEEPPRRESYALGYGSLARFDDSYLIIDAMNPAGERTGTRLRVLGKSAASRYRIVELSESPLRDQGDRE